MAGVVRMVVVVTGVATVGVFLPVIVDVVVTVVRGVVGL